jgi:metal-sulfur cluster biosynthetic enzyme
MMDLDDFVQQVKDGESPMSNLLTEKEIARIRKLSNIKEKITEVLKLIHDPEIPVNVWDLGLIYDINVSDEKKEAVIKMTLTSATCPVAEYIPPEIKKKVEEVVTEIKSVTIELVWEPAWDQDMMTDEARFMLDMM